MRIVDERGRLFGKINVIDLGVLLFVAVLVPLGYAAYVLFRTPPPRIVAVVPSTLPAASGVERRVQIKGEHLRPFLRAKLGTLDVGGFFVETPQAGEIRFTDVPPGVYDVVLLDEGQEIMRVPGGLTIAPPPVQIAGWFAGFSASDGLVPGVTFGPASHPIAELLEIDQTRDASRRGATLRATCQLSPEKRCVVGGTVVVAGAELNLTMPGKSDRTTFLVNDLRIDENWVAVKVRLMGLPESLALVRPGDVDRRADDTPFTPVTGLTTGAILRSLGVLQKNQGSFAITTSQPQSVVRDLTAYGTLSAVLPVDAQYAELMMPVESSATGLRYHDAQIRPGGIIPFDTGKYRLQALILSVSTPAPTAPPLERP